MTKKNYNLLPCTLAVQKRSRARFLIHGLWFEQNRNRKQVEVCKLKEISQLNVPNKLFKRMAEWWPSCNLKRKDEEFRKFEFCKHGYIFGQGEYYDITIKAFDFFMDNIELFPQANELSVGGEIKIPLLYDMQNKSFQQNGCPIVNDYANKLKSVYDDIALRLETMPKSRKKNKEEYDRLHKRLMELLKKHFKEEKEEKREKKEKTEEKEERIERKEKEKKAGRKRLRRKKRKTEKKTI